MMVTQMERPPVKPISHPWVTWRCPKCNRILARVRLTSGSAVEVKCKHCNEILAIMEAA